MTETNLKPGDKHYKAYIGPPKQYDFMGATQFRLLCSLGLRDTHKVLDFGCGSLRAGRLLINYLNKGCYYGIEPNKWLIEDAIKEQIGQDCIDLKKPTFDHNSDFNTSVFNTTFQFIIAQSIFSHTGPELIEQALNQFKTNLAENGLIVVTFIEDDSDFTGTGWIYPECVNYTKESILNFADKANLAITRLPWFHPRQTWYILAKNKSSLPASHHLKYLTGMVLNDPEFSDSVPTE